MFFPENITYYRPHRPFTVLYYVSGKSKEQVFHVTHSQSIAKGLYVGVDYRLTNSIGTYDRQQTNEYSLGLNFHFSRPEIRYQARTNLTTNLLKVTENGGIADISFLNNNKEQNRTLLQVNLTDAMQPHSSNRRIFSSFFLSGQVKTNPCRKLILEHDCKYI